ncbi:hypothetical protein C1903_06250 [Listeria ivanovii]|nr:hypothetical protein C1905_06770 [Listeria ivanovii]PZF94858.1 hypothetical protein C1903_06250 [Listeria ivanovii]PZG05352.1 hypothetical protein C2L88_06245 [Listeria ivanovii]PZG10012.1 hypothetical protein C1901_06060 [Listeria ivanovii]PZG26855.1 hypothetical protein C1900_06775 [Listeria ivanovii]
MENNEKKVAVLSELIICNNGTLLVIGFPVTKTNSCHTPNNFGTKKRVSNSCLLVIIKEKEMRLL